MRWLVLLAVVGCAVDGSPQPVNDDSPEIDGEYLDPARGACYGGIGGDIRCSSSTCMTEGEYACGRRTDCFISYLLVDDVAWFRGCFPAGSRSATGACDTLDAYRCVRRSDCAAVYRGNAVWPSFARCEDDPWELARY